MLTIELFLLSCLSVVNCQRYYAFIEALFVIDPTCFPPLTSLSYREYVDIVVNTANMVFQSNNDLDVKIEVVVSNVVEIPNIMIQSSQEPTVYVSRLRAHIADYDKYDTVVMLSYQPWEGQQGAQGYAFFDGLCNPDIKIMYLLPYQNAGFYLAHELGHQLGMQHQLESACPTTAFMSVMTTTHTVSYERARWSKCENDLINKNICKFTCVFNQPPGYQPLQNKYSTLPGQRMKNDQQAKTASSNERALGELPDHTFKSTDGASRCLYLHHYTGKPNGESMFEYSPMLPGSDCGDDSMCLLDRCVPKAQIDPTLLNPTYDTNVLNLAQHCSSGDDPKQLETSNTDVHHHECVNLEDDFLCAPSVPCPTDKDTSLAGLYIKHVCCEKCSKKSASFLSYNSRASTSEHYSLFILVVVSIIFFTQ